MANHLLRIDVKAILDRLQKAQEEIRYCYDELESIGVLNMVPGGKNIVYEYKPSMKDMEKFNGLSKEGFAKIMQNFRETAPGTLCPLENMTKKKEKELWLESINAKVFPEPVKYTYMFPGYHGAFNLSERYVNETPLDELKETYKQNERHALSAIQAEHDRAVSACMLGELKKPF